MSMKIFSVVATFLACSLLCGFQQETSPSQQEPGSKNGSAKQHKADSRKGTHGSAPTGQTADDAPDKSAATPTGARQSDKVEVTALPPEIAIRQVKDPIDRTILYCTIALTIVGVVGLCGGVWPLLAIKDQAKTLHEHSEELRKLAGAARENAGAARENAEAARLIRRHRKSVAEGTIYCSLRID